MPLPRRSRPPCVAFSLLMAVLLLPLPFGGRLASSTSPPAPYAPAGPSLYSFRAPLAFFCPFSRVPRPLSSAATPPFATAAGSSTSSSDNIQQQQQQQRLQSAAGGAEERRERRTCRICHQTYVAAANHDGACRCVFERVCARRGGYHESCTSATLSVVTTGKEMSITPSSPITLTHHAHGHNHTISGFTLATTWGTSGPNSMEHARGALTQDWPDFGIAAGRRTPWLRAARRVNTRATKNEWMDGMTDVEWTSTAIQSKTIIVHHNFKEHLFFSITNSFSFSLNFWF